MRPLAARVGNYPLSKIGRIEVVDSVRGIAACVVVIHHGLSDAGGLERFVFSQWHAVQEFTVAVGSVLILGATLAPGSIETVPVSIALAAAFDRMVTVPGAALGRRLAPTGRDSRRAPRPIDGEGRL